MLLEEYLNAVDSYWNGIEIGNPKIIRAPSLPQQIPTIGHVRDIISASFSKIGNLLNDLYYHLSVSAASFDSHSKSSLERAFADYFAVDSA